MRIGRIVLKILFVAIAAGWQLFSTMQYYNESHPVMVKQPIRDGLYAVNTFVVNHDTVAPSYTDSLRWTDVIFEQAGFGSIKTADTSFRQRYKRGYFVYTLDSTRHTVDFKKFKGDSLAIASFVYEIPDSSTLLLRGRQRTDSLCIVLKRTNRHFQLTERQFHWLSEANR